MQRLLFGRKYLTLLQRLQSLVEIVASMLFFCLTFWISSLNRSHLWQKFQVRHRSSSTSLEQRSTVTKVKMRHAKTGISTSFISETFSPYETMTKIQRASKNNISYRHKKGAPINPSSLRSTRFVIEPDQLPRCWLTGPVCVADSHV